MMSRSSRRIQESIEGNKAFSPSSRKSPVPVFERRWRTTGKSFLPLSRAGAHGERLGAADRRHSAMVGRRMRLPWAGGSGLPCECRARFVQWLLPDLPDSIPACL